ncbi:dimethylamine monooxygenase subunit DmmA family protein [Arthrobacter sp. NPDC056493]|uniref:dimethylamine monooxygenase subunit DmmA family protein n=1 Tax=Arthrobacter sp. NPDC056493 TaxID=3345839 RepID=UPI00366E7818
MRSASMPLAGGTGLEPGFRGVICASFGATGDTAGQHTGVQPRHDLHFEYATQETLSDLRSVLGRSHVGVRLVLAGPPADIRAAAAAAADCGLQQEEITLLSDETAPRVIYCGHCRATTKTVRPAGEEVQCQGCATTLATTDHFSRRMGAYLGYSAHAEEAS